MNEGNKVDLTEKQEAFCKEYIKGFNATEAYINAGYATKKRNVAKVEASKLLTNPNIQSKINQLKEMRNQKLDIDSEWVLKEAVDLYKMAKGIIPINDGKTLVQKTNLREASKLLEMIGKHVSIMAFDLKGKENLNAEKKPHTVIILPDNGRTIR